MKARGVLSWRALAYALLAVFTSPACAQLRTGKSAATNQTKAVAPERAGLTGGNATNVRYPQYDAQNRLKSLLIGRNLKLGSNFSDATIEGLRVESYKEGGAVDFVAEAPQCHFSVSTRVADSPGPLRAYTADQRMEIAGVGFLFVQTNSSLVISNEVHTTIRRDAVNVLPGKAVGTNASATNAPPVKRAGTNAALEKPLEIFADHFHFDLNSKLVVYRGHVRIDDSQMRMTCGRLTVHLAEQGGSFEKIVAEESVVMTSVADGSRVQAGLAVYTRSTEMIELTGQPTWQQGLRESSADKVTFNRLDRGLEADGNVRVKLPRDAIGKGGFELASTALRTNALPATNAATSVTTNAATNTTFVVVTAEHLHSHSNLTVARGSVRVQDATNLLTCARLTLQQATGDSPEEIAVAEENVVVEQGAKRVQADRAVYSKTEDTALFTGHPRWQLDQSEGRADTLLLHPRTNSLHATGNAWIKLLRGTNSGAILPLFPATNAVARRKSEPVELFADRFDVAERAALFSGNVHGHESPITGAEPRLKCPTLEVRFAAKGNHAESAVAKGGVVVEQGTPGVTNGPAVYQKFAARTITASMNPKTGELVNLFGEGEVSIEHPSGRATGEHAAYELETDTVRLTGNPKLVAAQVEIMQAEVLIWDRANNRFTAPMYREMTVFPSAFRKTNAPGPLKK